MILTIPLFEQIQNSLFSSLGGNQVGGYLFVLMVMVVFIIGFIVAGVPFRFAILFSIPFIWGASSIGWLPNWVEGLFWFFIIGYGIYLFYTLIMSRS